MRKEVSVEEIFQRLTSKDLKSRRWNRYEGPCVSTALPRHLWTPVTRQDPDRSYRCRRQTNFRAANLRILEADLEGARDLKLEDGRVFDDPASQDDRLLGRQGEHKCFGAETNDWGYNKKTSHRTETVQQRRCGKLDFLFTFLFPRSANLALFKPNK